MLDAHRCQTDVRVDCAADTSPRKAH